MPSETASSNDQLGNRCLALAVGADEAYGLPLAVALHTALERIVKHASIEVIVLDGGMLPNTRRRIRRVIENARPRVAVTWLEEDTTKFEVLPVLFERGEATYLRLLIPDRVNSSVEYVVYLDSDMVVQRDLTDLVEVVRKTPGHAVFAVQAGNYPTVLDAFGARGVAALDLTTTSSYFNSGLMLIDVDVWRRLRLADKALNVARDHAELMRFADQDALNAALDGHWCDIDDRWNVIVRDISRRASGTPRQRRKRIREETESAFVIHYAGSKKPWRPGYVGPGGRLFRRHLYRSGWFQNPIERATWMARYWLSPGDWLLGAKLVIARRFPRLHRLLSRTP